MIEQIVESIIGGHFLHRGNNIDFLIHGDLDELSQGGHKIAEHYLGNKFNLCSIVNGRSGRCSEDCKYCAQSAHYETGVEEYPFLSLEEIKRSCRENAEAGVHRFSVVTAGRAIAGRELEQALKTYRYLHEHYDIELCASHGLLPQEDFAKLKRAGVSRYHANIETSRRYFHNICSTHTFEDKVACITRAREAGMEVCSGGIIGMGETMEDRVDMAFDFLELGVDSIPINVLSPIKGTPFENLPPISEDEILRSLLVFRYINPKAEVRFAAGRIRLKDSGRPAFQAGIHAAITGNMLTTSGNNIEQDKEMLTNMGFIL